MAHLRLIFATRELAYQHLNPKSIKVHLITPEPFRTSTLLHPKNFLRDRGILPQEILDIKPLNPGEKSSIQLLIEELDKIEEDWNRPETSKNSTI